MPFATDENDDYAAERAYDRAVRRHKQDDAREYRDTGGQLDPMPPFDEWLTGPLSDVEDTDDDAVSCADA